MLSCFRGPTTWGLSDRSRSTSLGFRDAHDHELSLDVLSQTAPFGLSNGSHLVSQYARCEILGVSYRVTCSSSTSCLSSYLDEANGVNRGYTGKIHVIGVRLRRTSRRCCSLYSSGLVDEA